MICLFILNNPPAALVIVIPALATEVKDNAISPPHSLLNCILIVAPVKLTTTLFLIKAKLFELLGFFPSISIYF